MHYRNFEDSLKTQLHPHTEKDCTTTATSSLPLLNLSCFHPPKVRFILDPSLNAMHHTATTHTHTKN